MNDIRLLSTDFDGTLIGHPSATECDEHFAEVIEGFSFQRNTIYLRFCHSDHDKGSALAELCRLEGLTPDEVFAAGDHHNDLPMLRRERARWLACPANAIGEVNGHGSSTVCLFHRPQ